MASATSGIAKMIVQYDWILEDVEKEPMTIASKMILFRGEKVFRVGVKNNFHSPVLFFMAVDLNKMGMKTGGVTYGIQDGGISPTTMTQMTQEIISDGSLQLFNVELQTRVTRNCRLIFRICIEGSVPGFCYRLSDRLVKDQLWDAATVKSQNWVDVEFLVKNKKFFAHKAILAARSKIFAAEFTNEQKGNDQSVRIRIDDVEPSTVEQFLHFIYTGESMGTLANEDLLKLADDYQLTTLSSLCRTALEKIKPMQMVKLAINLNKEDEILSSKIRYTKCSLFPFTFELGLKLALYILITCYLFHFSL
jgi:speckle-type POZ protein